MALTGVDARGDWGRKATVGKHAMLEIATSSAATIPVAAVLRIAGTNADANEELSPDELRAGELADGAWARKDIAMITSSRKWH